MPQAAEKTLLVIEDDPVITFIVRKMIERQRGPAVQVLNSQNGKEGIETARKHKPDLILLDWMMADYDGEYFLKQQLKTPELVDVPVLIYTALSEEKLEKIKKTYPAVKLSIHKPVLPSKLYQKMEPFLKGPETPPTGPNPA